MPPSQSVRSCIVCGQPVTLARGTPKTCSEACAHEAMRRAGAQRDRVQRPPLRLSGELRALTAKHGEAGARRAWSLMKSRGRLLLVLRDHPDATLAQLAEALGLTGRRVQQIIRELAAFNVVTITKAGRRNTYQVNLDLE
jgi:predicted nucleic acid-binding Zn ribbon protein